MAVSIMTASENLKTPSRDELIQAVSELNESMSVPMPPETPAEGSHGGAAASNRENMTPLERISSARPGGDSGGAQAGKAEIAAYVLSHLPIEKIYEVLTLLGDLRESVEARLISIKDVPIAKELEEKILKNISERLA